VAAFSAGAGIGTLGGLIGLGGAEFRLPLLIGLCLGLELWKRSFSTPKLITLIRHKSLFYKEGQANLRIGSCLQFKWHLEQVQGTLL
jgi:uncharacterized membrane protein YfcA